MLTVLEITMEIKKLGNVSDRIVESIELFNKNSISKSKHIINFRCFV